MAYYPTERQVKRNLGLLSQIRDAIANDNDIIISPSDSQSPGGAKYWLRNLFASADQFPDYGFSGLGARTVVSIMDDGRIRCYPSGAPTATSPTIVELDEMSVLSEAMTGRMHINTVFKPSEEFEKESFLEALQELGYYAKFRQEGDRGAVELTKIETTDEDSSPFDLV